MSRYTMTKGVVIQFRRSRRSYTPRHFLIEVEGTDSRDKAKKFVGQTVVWTADGKNNTQITGKIASAHGNKGVMRAIFEKGLPGQAIGTECEISGSVAKETKTVKVEKK